MASPAILVMALIWRNIVLAFLSNGLQVSADWEPGEDWDPSRKDRPCYWPDGSLSLTTFPCRYYPEASICCSIGWACMVEGFCYLNASGIAERQACTASNWDDPGCPLMCRQTGGPNRIDHCPSLDPKPSWCCSRQVNGDPSGDDCCSTTDPRDLYNLNLTSYGRIVGEGSISMKGSGTSSTNTDDSASLASTISATRTALATNSRLSTSTSTTVVWLPAATQSQSQSPIERHRPMIIGVTVGVPVGLLAIALLSYILRRYIKRQAPNAAGVYFPPDPIDPFATQVFPKAELDTFPNAISELNGDAAPSELDSSPIAAMDTNRNSVFSELEGSQAVPPDPNNRNPVVTAVTAGSLQSASHQQRPREQRSLAPHPRNSHRLSGPAPWFLPAVEESEGETLTPKPSADGMNEQGTNSGEAQGEEQNLEAGEVEEGEQGTNNEEAPKSGEAVEAAAKSHEDEITQHSENTLDRSTMARAVEDVQVAADSHDDGTAPHGEGAHQSSPKPASVE